MGEKGKGRLPLKVPKPYKRNPNRMFAYLKEKHHAFIVGMIFIEGYRNQSECTNEAYRLWQEQYCERHGKDALKKVVEKGRSVISKLREKERLKKNEDGE